MTQKNMIRLIVIAIVAAFASAFLLQDNGTELSPEKEGVIQQALRMVVSQAHLQPADIDDQFSQQVFTDFLESLDGRKRFLLQSDIHKLKQYQTELDDQLIVADLTFFDEATQLLDQRIAEAKTYYEIALAEPFDYTVEEEIETDFEKIDYAITEADLQARWYQRLKLYTLQEVYSRLKNQETESSEDDEGKSEPKSFGQIEEEARESIKENYHKWYESYEKVRRSDRFEQYLNAILSQYDPHTTYFSPKGKQDFAMRMGGKLEGIGAQLRTEGDLTQVTSVVPGGPTWKDGQIEVNDFILKVAQDGEEPLDITGMRIDDVVSHIRGPKGTKVTLTIRKKDGSEVGVTITRDVINLEIARARGAILEREDSGDKYGYIDLPMFYNSFDDEANSSAADVSRLIDSLKDEGMDGLILDLRDNLGGALVDAIDISGLFIEQGPIVQVKSRDRRPYVHKDTDKSVQYDGPLVVLINSYSASASEIVAGALQDYGRAIIVGGQSFGKGSVQNFIDLDRHVNGNADIKPLGEVKLTIQKYYRVNGASTQLKGVTPDIPLPDIYDLLPTGERENDQALSWSKIKNVNYGQDVLRYHDIDIVRTKSADRVRQDTSFALISEHAQWLKDNKDKSLQSLHLDTYTAERSAIEAMTERYDEILDIPVEGLSVSPIHIEFESEISEEEEQARTTSWQEMVEKDFYLEEAMDILGDVVHSDWYMTRADR